VTPGLKEVQSQMKINEILLESKLAEEFNMTLTEMSLTFVYHQWFVTSTVVGATSVEQLKENLAAFKKIIPNEIIQKIDFIHLSCMNPAP